jgi:hypothetical protein
MVDCRVQKRWWPNHRVSISSAKILIKFTNKFLLIFLLNILKNFAFCCENLRGISGAVGRVFHFWKEYSRRGSWVQFSARGNNFLVIFLAYGNFDHNFAKNKIEKQLPIEVWFYRSTVRQKLAVFLHHRIHWDWHSIRIKLAVSLPHIVHPNFRVSHILSPKNFGIFGNFFKIFIG